MFCARLRVKRMSAYEQPRRFASPSAAVDQSRYFGSRPAGACSRAGSKVRAYAQRGTPAATAPAPSVWRNVLRDGCIGRVYRGQISIFSCWVQLETNEKIEI